LINYQPNGMLPIIRTNNKVTRPSNVSVHQVKAKLQLQDPSVKRLSQKDEDFLSNLSPAGITGQLFDDARSISQMSSIGKKAQTFAKLDLKQKNAGKLTGMKYVIKEGKA
jgi:hypothetical protein